MSVIDRIKSGTTSERDVEEVAMHNRFWGISGFFIGVLVTLLIIGIAISIYLGG